MDSNHQSNDEARLPFLAETPLANSFRKGDEKEEEDGENNHNNNNRRNNSGPDDGEHNNNANTRSRPTKGEGEITPAPLPSSSSSLHRTEEDELRESKRLKYAIFFLFANVALQAFAGSGIQAILDMYMEDFLELSDTFSNSLTAMYIVIYCAVAPISGYLSDRLWGNYKTQLISQVIWLVGTALLLVATFPVVYHFLGGVTSGSMRSVPIIGLVFAGLGYGLLQPIQSVLIADQYLYQSDPSLQQRSFAWLFFWDNVGDFGGESINPQLRKSKGPEYAMLTISGTLLLSVLAYVLGRPYYIMKPPAISTKENSSSESETDEEAETIPLLHGNNANGKSNIRSRRQKLSLLEKWRKWKETENAKCLGRVSLIFSTMLVFWSIMNQQSDSWVSQGASMNCTICFGSSHCVDVAPDIMPSINDLMDLVIIVGLEYFIYPTYKRMTGTELRALAKIGVGMLFCGLSFLIASFLEVEIGNRCDNCISLLWQLPQYWFVSVAEVMVSVPALEFAYSQSPDSLRGIVTAMWFITQALGNLLDVIVFLGLSTVVAWVQYYVFTVLMFVSTLIFGLVVSKYTYVEESTVTVVPLPASAPTTNS